MPELMLLSNSFSPGRGALEHALDTLGAFFAYARQVLFVPYAASDPDWYTETMQEILGQLGVQVSGAHRAADPLAALDRADAVFVGGGNAFRLLRAARDQRLGEFLDENDVPVLGLCEGSWLHVSAARATAGGTAGGRVLTRGCSPRDVQPGDDLTALLSSRPSYDSPAR
jgi:dipeptidase E